MSAKDERSTVHSPAGPARFAVARDRRTLDVGRCVTRLLYKPARAACRERTVHGSQATPIVVPHVLFFMFFMLVDIFLRFMWVDESPHKNEIYMRARARDPEERNDKTGYTAFIRTLTPVTLSEISLYCLSTQCASRRASPCTVHGPRGAHQATDTTAPLYSTQEQERSRPTSALETPQ